MHPETKRREYVSSIHRELEIERNWYKHGLSKIIDMIVWNESLNDLEKLIEAKSIAMSCLDGEPTTADEYNTMTAEDNLHYAKKAEEMQNVVYISDVNKEIAKEWKKDTMQEDEKLVFEEQFGGDTGTDADYSKEEE